MLAVTSTGLTQQAHPAVDAIIAVVFGVKGPARYFQSSPLHKEVRGTSA